MPGGRKHEGSPVFERGRLLEPIGVGLFARRGRLEKGFAELFGHFVFAELIEKRPPPLVAVTATGEGEQLFRVPSIDPPRGVAPANGRPRISFRFHGVFSIGGCAPLAVGRPAPTPS